MQISPPTQVSGKFIYPTFGTVYSGAWLGDGVPRDASNRLVMTSPLSAEKEAGGGTQITLIAGKVFEIRLECRLGDKLVETRGKDGVGHLSFTAAPTWPTHALTVRAFLPNSTDTGRVAEISVLHDQGTPEHLPGSSDEALDLRFRVPTAEGLHVGLVTRAADLQKHPICAAHHSDKS